MVKNEKNKPKPKTCFFEIKTATNIVAVINVVHLPGFEPGTTVP